MSNNENNIADEIFKTQEFHDAFISAMTQLNKKHAEEMDAALKRLEDSRGLLIESEL
jgi:hypothetical protein